MFNLYIHSQFADVLWHKIFLNKKTIIIVIVIVIVIIIIIMWGERVWTLNFEIKVWYDINPLARKKFKRVMLGPPKSCVNFDGPIITKFKSNSLQVPEYPN